MKAEAGFSCKIHSLRFVHKLFFKVEPNMRLQQCKLRLLFVSNKQKRDFGTKKNVDSRIST